MVIKKGKYSNKPVKQAGRQASYEAEILKPSFISMKLFLLDIVPQYYMTAAVES